MAEVEAEVFGRHERALLRDMLAEPAAQHRMQKMRDGMVGAQPRAALAVDAHLDRVAEPETALGQLADMNVEGVEILHRVLDREDGQITRLTPSHSCQSL